MSKASDYIRDYTKRCSNAIEGCNQDAYYSEGLYQPWLTPENALAAVEIERQEVIEEVVNWLSNNAQEYIAYNLARNIPVLNIEVLKEDLKQAMKKEK